MWHNVYKDHPPDTPIKKEQLTSGKGIVGCEMHDLTGWGESFHRPRPKKSRGIIRIFLDRLFGQKNEKES